MNLEEYATHDAIGLGELVAKGDVSSDELVALAREGIEKTNPALNFLVRELEEPVTGEASGAMGGVPFLVKDMLIQAAGIPQTMGSRALAGDIFSAPHSSELFKRFQKAGLTTIGRTATPEFAFNGTTEPVANGPTRNPWNTSVSSGGSSGGSAAAVAAGVVPLAHGNDGGGSLRIPAAACGLVGLKPSRGRTPLGPDYQLPLMGMVSEFAMTRTTRDSAMLLDLVNGPEANSFVPLAKPETPYSESIKRPMAGLRIAIAPMGFKGEKPTQKSLSDEVRRVGTLLSSMGHNVTDISHIPFEPEQFHTANYRFWMSFLARGVYGLAQALGVEPSTDLFETCTLRGAEAGLKVTAPMIEEGIQIMSGICQQMGTFFSDYDAVVLPPYANLALPLGDSNQNHPDWTIEQYYEELFARFNSTSPFNMTGQPAIAVPTGMVDGVPAGVQIAAPVAREDILLNLSAQLEEGTNWTSRRPGIHVANG